MNRREFIKYSSLAAGAGMISPAAVSGQDREAIAGKRVGIIGLDTSHSEVFSRLINRDEPGMKGFKVTAAYPHGSRDIPSALKMKPGIIKAVKDMGIRIVDSIDELLKEVDVVLLESNDGKVHAGQALPVFKAGKRVFIDKPLASSLAQVRAIFEASGEYGAPMFTSSALRFDVNVQKVAGGAIGKITGADVYTPAEIDPGHLDLAWYAIHGVEMLFTVMGPDCRQVSRTFTEGADLVTGVWGDGRIGTVRAIRQGAAGIAGTAFGEKGIAPLGPFSTYEPLVTEIVKFFESGTPPVSEKETLAIFKFIDAAQKSRKKKGGIVRL